MTNGDRSSIDVDLFNIQPKFTHAVDVHRSKSFVDLLSCMVNLHSDPNNWGGVTSNRSTSSFEIPAWLRTFGMAIVGPIPMIRGATPGKRGICTTPVGDCD